MSGSTRIKGTALTLTLGGVEYKADITSVTLDNEEADSDVTTFADAEAGGARQYFLSGTAIQSTDSSSFWSMVEANTGTAAAFRLGVHGNATANADQPHYSGTLKVGPKPPLGGDANKTQVFDWRFDIDGEPVLDRGSDPDAAITAILPAGRQAGKDVIISGTRFTGATDVKFGTTSVTSFNVVSDTLISAVIPTGTGSKAVTVITPSGTSAAVNYTVAS